MKNTQKKIKKSVDMGLISKKKWVGGFFHFQSAHSRHFSGQVPLPGHRSTDGEIPIGEKDIGHVGYFQGTEAEDLLDFVQNRRRRLSKMCEHVVDVFS